MPDRLFNVLLCVLLVCLPRLVHIKGLGDYLLVYVLLAVFCSPATVVAACLAASGRRWLTLLYVGLLMPLPLMPLVLLPMRELSDTWLFTTVGVVWVGACSGVLALRFRRLLAPCGQGQTDAAAT